MGRNSRNVWMKAVVMLMVVVLGGRQWLMAEEAGHAHQGADAKAGSLHSTMEQMGKLFKQVRGDLKDTSKYSEAADAVAKMEILVVHAKMLTPEKVEKMPTDQQAAAKKQYRTDMCELLGHLSELESALLAGDQAKANAAMQACGGVMKEGHEEFREKDD